MDDDLWQDPEFREKDRNRAAEIAAGAGETQNVQLRVIAVDEVK